MSLSCLSTGLLQLLPGICPVFQLPVNTLCALHIFIQPFTTWIGPPGNRCYLEQMLIKRLWNWIWVQVILLSGEAMTVCSALCSWWHRQTALFLLHTGLTPNSLTAHSKGYCHRWTLSVISANRGSATCVTLLYILWLKKLRGAILCAAGDRHFVELHSPLNAVRVGTSASFPDRIARAIIWVQRLLICMLQSVWKHSELRTT